jgi:ubiquitin-like 1-activating enzyme E1 B
MSKSLVAKETILKLNPNLNIEAHHMNIKDLQISFFRQFGFIIMALDNIEARNYVNRIGVRLNIPIIDAGTLAYKGNATTILRGISKCYSCEPKSSNQKVFPVCTIRMRPEKPIHCIVWAKMLFEVKLIL